MERTRRWGALASAVMLVVAVGANGCDGDLDMDPDAGVATLVVRVLTGPEGADLATYEPVPGATVALDAPGGARLEDVSGLDGRATFTGLDFSRGTAGVTVHVVGHQLQSVLGIADASAEVLVLMGSSPIAGYSTVSVTGQALNVDHAYVTYGLSVGALAPSGIGYASSAGASGQYSLVVPANEPFALVAFAVHYKDLPSGRGFSADLFTSTILPNQLVEASSVIDVDLANAAETKSATGRVAVPQLAWCNGIRFNGIAAVSVLSDVEDTGASIGRPASVEFDETRAGFDYEVRWVEPDGVRTPVTAFGVGNADYGSIVYQHGFPPSGPQDLKFLDCPGPLASDNAGLRSTFTWTLHDEPGMLRLYLQRAGQGTTWCLDFPSSFRSVTLPALPSTVDAMELFGAGTQVAVLLEVDRSSPTTYTGISSGPGTEIQSP
jgi:hypothetical protein